MNSASVKAKGRTWENEVAQFLNESGLFEGVERRRQTGALDKGDLVNTSPFVFQCKNHKAIKLAEFIDQAEAQAVNADEPFGLAVIKRPRKPVGKAYLLLSLDSFIRLLGEWSCGDCCQ